MKTAAGEVWMSTVAGGGWPAWMPVGVGDAGGSVVQAISLGGGERVAFLMSGAARVIVARVGSGGAPECAAALELPGEVRDEGALFTRGLVAVGRRRILVATSVGVVAVRVSEACPPVLQIEPTFHGEVLRGPIDGGR
ncbi:MAG: hypothetical protein R3B70_08165 [Polyangiaceae bacterium]